jgi:hypothetical protein
MSGYQRIMIEGGSEQRASERTEKSRAVGRKEMRRRRDGNERETDSIDNSFKLPTHLLNLVNQI